MQKDLNSSNKTDIGLFWRVQTRRVDHIEKGTPFMFELNFTNKFCESSSLESQSCLTSGSEILKTTINPKGTAATASSTNGSHVAT